MPYARLFGMAELMHDAAERVMPQTCLTMPPRAAGGIP